MLTPTKLHGWKAGCLACLMAFVRSLYTRHPHPEQKQKQQLETRPLPPSHVRGHLASSSYSSSSQLTAPDMQSNPPTTSLPIHLFSRFLLTLPTQISQLMMYCPISAHTRIRQFQIYPSHPIPSDLFLPLHTSLLCSLIVSAKCQLRATVSK